MANPRYYNPPADRGSRRDRNLALALQLAGVSQDQQANADRAHAARVAQALQLLGFQQQAEQDKIRQQQAADMLGFQKSNAEREGSQFNQRLAFDEKKLSADQTQNADATQRMTHLAIMNYLQNQPNADPNIGLNFAASIDPVFGDAQTKANAAALAKQIGALQPQYNALANDPNTRGQFESALPANVVAGLGEGYKRSTMGVPEGVASGPAGPSRTSFLGPRAGQQPVQPSLPDLPQQAPAFGVSSYGAPQVNPKAILDWYLRQFAYK